MASQEELSASIDLTEPFDSCDVVFLFDDHSRLYFKRSILSSLSPVFEAWFSGRWSEMKEVPLPGKSIDEIHTFLRFLRKSDTSNPFVNENVHILLKLGDEYQMESVFADCSNYILTNWKKDPEKHLQAVDLAAQYGLKSLMNAFVPLASMRPFEDISALAPVLPSNVYAALVHCHVLQQKQFDSPPPLRMACWPRCQRYGTAFGCGACYYNNEHCAAGACLIGELSFCRDCESQELISAHECVGCCINIWRDKRCYCDAAVEHWLANEVVALLLKRKA